MICAPCSIQSFWKPDLAWYDHQDVVVSGSGRQVWKPREGVQETMLNGTHDDTPVKGKVRDSVSGTSRQLLPGQPPMPVK